MERICLSFTREEARIMQWALRRAVEHASSSEVRRSALALDVAIGALLLGATDQR